MTLPVLVPILCACGWTGSVHTRGRCGNCQARHTHRVNPGRLAWLRAIAAGTQEQPPPMTIRWLRDRKLIGPAGLTAAGEHVLAAAKQVEHEAGLRREIAAESVARHAGIGEP